jgi:hypothetical protein
LFKIESDSSVGSYATIPEVTKIVAPNVKFDLLDATSHDSTGGFKEYIPGLGGWRERYRRTSGLCRRTRIHTQLAYGLLREDPEELQDRVCVGRYRQLPIAFAGYVVGLNPQADAGQLQKNMLTTKVTGYSRPGRRAMDFRA